MVLPKIWWACACHVEDALGNELVVYEDVFAVTQVEAYNRAASRVGIRNLMLHSATITPCPERKGTDEWEAPLAALPAPAPKPVEPWEFFPAMAVKKYGNTTHIGSGKEEK